MSFPIMRMEWQMCSGSRRFFLMSLTLLGIGTTSQALSETKQFAVKPISPVTSSFFGDGEAMFGNGAAGFASGEAATARRIAFTRDRLIHDQMNGLTDPASPRHSFLGFILPPVPARKPVPRSDMALSAEDAALYARIFAMQAEGNIRQADRLLAKVADDRLKGHVLFQRYVHPTAYKPSFDELVSWMKTYADLPGAARIYRLAQARAPKNYKGTIPPAAMGAKVNSYLTALSERGQPYQADAVRSDSDMASIAALRTAIRADIGEGKPTAALSKLKTDPAAKLLDDAESDQLRGAIARAYMIAGELDKASSLALSAARRSGAKAPEAAWIGGLLSWRKGQFGRAAHLFEQVADSPHASSWMVSGGAYWASRAYMRSGKLAKVDALLQRSAAYPRTFYGLIATRALGRDFDFNWKLPTYTAAHRKTLAKVPAFARAEALVESGQLSYAEAELRRVNPGSDENMREALIAYASHAGMPALAMRLAEAYAAPEGGFYDAALYPLVPWKPEGGYTVDRALIHAVIRQESRFDPDARNASGATGLMQVMPTTATFVSGNGGYIDATGFHALKDPRTNLDIGQRYVANLLGTAHVGSEMMSLLIAYNAGPGNLRKWKRENADTLADPLLFVETIPMGETRAYVERVMANYWIYRLRLGQPTPSLDAVTEGQWARYVGIDGDREMESARIGISASARALLMADASR